MSSTDNVSLGSNHICEPPIDAAFSLHGTWSVNDIFPFSNASIISKILITFVTDAGLNCSCMLCAYNTFPVVCSIKIAEPDSRFSELFSCISEFVSTVFVFTFSGVVEVSIVDHIYDSSFANDLIEIEKSMTKIMHSIDIFLKNLIIVPPFSI